MTPDDLDPIRRELAVRRAADEQRITIPTAALVAGDLRRRRARRTRAQRIVAVACAVVLVAGLRVGVGGGGGEDPAAPDRSGATSTSATPSTSASTTTGAGDGCWAAAPGEPPVCALDARPAVAAVDEQGSPVGGARVAVAPEGGEREVLGETDGAGRLEMDQLPPGPGVVAVSATVERPSGCVEVLGARREVLDLAELGSLVLVLHPVGGPSRC